MYEAYIDIARAIRDEMVRKYGEFLAGRCIEASDKIVERVFSSLGVEAVAVEGWCQYDDEYFGSDRPWGEHTWVEVPSLNLYIDVTADQFNYGMDSENEFPRVLVREGLPHGMRYNEPSWDEYEESKGDNIPLDEVISFCDGMNKNCSVDSYKHVNINNER